MASLKQWWRALVALKILFSRFMEDVKRTREIEKMMDDLIKGAKK